MNKVRVLIHRDDAVLPDVWEWDQHAYPMEPTEIVKQALRCRGLWFGERDALPRAVVGRSHTERGVRVWLVAFDMGHMHTETRIDFWGRAHEVETWIPHPCRARVEVAEDEWPKALLVRSRRWNAVHSMRCEVVERFIRRGGMRVEMRGRKCVGIGYDDSEAPLNVPSVRLRDSKEGARKVEARLRTLYARRVAFDRDRFAAGLMEGLE